MKESRRTNKAFRHVCNLISLLTIILADRTAAAVFTDDFSGGLNGSYWQIDQNQPLYSVSTTQGGVTISKPLTSSTAYQYAKLTPKLTASGDFDVQVDFTNALLTTTGGGVGNQTELACYFGGRTYYVVRSCESGNQIVYAWINSVSPPGGTFGMQGWEATSGTMRIARTNFVISFWIDSTLLYQQNCDRSSATFAMFLINNGTKDATSVTFDAFRLAATSITFPPLLLSAQPVSSNLTLFSWPSYPAGYLLETTSNLSTQTSWQTVTDNIVSANGRCFLTNTSSEPAAFYRLRQGP